MILVMHVREEAGYLSTVCKSLDVGGVWFGTIEPKIQWREGWGRTGYQTREPMSSKMITEIPDDLAGIADPMNFRTRRSGPVYRCKKQIPCPA